MKLYESPITETGKITFSLKQQISHFLCYIYCTIIKTITVVQIKISRKRLVVNMTNTL